MTDYVLGNDISSWQRSNPRTKGDVDFNKMKLAGSNYCFFRAYFGTRKDVDFDTYWNDCAGILPRAAYYFPITAFTIKEQTKLFVNLLKPDMGEFKPVMDVERYNGTVNPASDWDYAAKAIEDGLGITPTLYTGRYMWQDDVFDSGNPKYNFERLDLWIAAYGYPYPILPKPWTTWKFWQWGEGKGQGLKFGVESLDIDMDSFNGNLNDFNAYIGGSAILNPEDPEEIIVPGMKFTTLSTMNIRNAPSISGDFLGTLPAGSEITAIDVGGDDAWVMVGENMWVCNSRKGNTYLK
jgi:GH25 family lysozyme M1 (1,4-beta-N-acetylmuramidase)